jgi:hypothetical protein
MERLSQAIERAHFWRDNAGQLRQLAQTPSVKLEAPKLLELAVEYERLADKVVEDWARA